jgi:predicted RNA-binding Zn ribbon-like protein
VEEQVFELSGGNLCLDFANTWSDRARPESDRLRSYADLLEFAAQAGTVTAAQSTVLRGRAANDPASASEALAAGRELRDALYRLFAAHARRREPTAEDLDRLNLALRQSLPHLRLERQASHDGGYAWVWDADDRDLLAPLRPVVRSAADLLASADLERVRECDGSTCTWLFLDASRNRSRRWCSMESCGNRAKAARHYHRSRAASD